MIDVCKTYDSGRVSASTLGDHANRPTDAEDEAMKRYKESLGITPGDFVEDPNDPRELIIMSLGLEVVGRPDIIIDLSSPGALESLKKNTFIIKEGCEFCMVSASRPISACQRLIEQCRKSSFAFRERF